MKRFAEKHPIYLLTFGAVCISFAPILVKMVGMGQMGLTAIGFWRMLFGGLALAGLALLGRRSLRISRRLVGWAALAGLLFCADLFVWHRSVAYAGAGLATILGNTQVFATAVLSFLLFHERLSLRFILAAISAMGGVVLLVGLAADITFSARYIEGVGFGLLTGLAYASYIIAIKQASRGAGEFDVMPFMTWTSVSCAVFLGVVSLFETEPFMPPDTTALMVVVALGLVSQALGWMAITHSLSRIEVSRAGLILLLQPILATVWGVIIFAEHLEATQMLGAAITLAAIYVGSLRRSRSS